MTDVLYGLDSAERERAAALRAEGRFFWIDASLAETDRADLTRALGLAEDAVRAVPAPGASTSRAFRVGTGFVIFTFRCYVGRDEGADRLRPIEAQVVVTPDYLLTLHEERLSLPAALDVDLLEERSRRYVVYSVLQAMLASTFDALEEVELTLDALAEAGADDGAGNVSRAKLREDAVQLTTMRRWVTAEQAMLERLEPEIAALRGFGPDEERYFDRLDAGVAALLASVDAAANGMGTLLDLQLNQRAYVVSVVATIFVPLSFVTGFFGMNFGWMIDRIHSPIAFWVLGFLVPLATAVLSWRLVLPRLFVGDNPRRKGVEPSP